MRTPPLRTVAAAFTSLLLILGSWAAAQAAPHRIVILPFDAEGSIDAFALSFPTALQRALNEIDGVFVPTVGDAGIVLQRAIDGDGDPIEAVARVFAADALVLARVVGSDTLFVDLVVLRDGEEERDLRLSGRIGDLPALWKALGDAILEASGVVPAVADRAAMRLVLDDAPSLPSLGPLGLASSRLPGARLDQLEAAATLDDGSAWVRSELARALALTGDVSRARAEAEAAVALQPTVETRAILGVVLLATNDQAAARAAFEAALAGNPHHAIALVGLAQAGGASDARTDLLERSIAAAPRLVDAHLALASIQTSPTRTVQVLRRAATSLPDSPAVQGALMEAALDAGDPRGALDLLRTAVRDPVGRNALVYALAGILPAEVRDGALALAREGVERFPDAAALRRLEIDLLRQGGDMAGAEVSLRAWVETGSAAVADVVALAEMLAARGDVDEAQAWLETVAEAPDADLRSAQIDLAAGRARAALATLEPTVAAGGADPLRRTLYGIALGRVGRRAEATELLQRIVAEGRAADASAEAAGAAGLANRALAILQEQRLIDGEGAVALSGEAAEAFQQGLYAIETNDLVAARDAFGRARALQDTGIVAFYEGYARQMLGDPRGAIASYQAARGDLGDSDVLLNNLGYAQLQVGRLDLALETLRLAVAANPDNARAHLNLGLAHYGLARFVDAVASFDAALALDPSLEATAGPTIEDARRRSTP
jgi:tetratricopeptide (TPR) repeat protein